ncbi:MAG TPA: hypothetical protein VNC18_15620 [Gemmatimonadaceae bacterium]|jgi:hypothetical protein|nr:hypothetical protein [Gemmatimonadaceae bacterium]
MKSALSALAACAVAGLVVMAAGGGSEKAMNDPKSATALLVE